MLVENNEEEDECNLINKDDFDEGKNTDIVTARATPIKHNALAKKNLTTNRKQNLHSPSLSAKLPIGGGGGGDSQCFNPFIYQATSSYGNFDK